MDSPYYSAEDKKVLKDQYIGVMSPFSEAAQSRSDVWRAWPTNYGGAGGQGQRQQAGGKAGKTFHEGTLSL